MLTVGASKKTNCSVVFDCHVRKKWHRRHGHMTDLDFHTGLPF